MADQTGTPRALPERLGLSTLWVELPSIRLHAATAGPEDGPLVVLLHGFPEFWYSFRHQIRPLAEAGFRVVVPDQRGYNLTGPHPPYDGATLVGDVIGLIEACGRRDALVVGHDWGAAVAWQLAASHPGRVNRLAILNVPHPAVLLHALRGGSWRQMRRSWYIFFFQLPWLPERVLARRHHARLRWLLRASSRRGTFTDEDLARYGEAWAIPGALTAAIGWYRALRKAPAASGGAARGGRVTAPTLVLWGERDAALGVELAEASMAWVDHGELVRFPEATHWLHEELPEVVTAHRLRHFRGSPGER